MISRDDTWHGRYGVLPGYGITLQVRVLAAAALWWFASSGGGLRVVAVVMLVNEWGWCCLVWYGAVWRGVVWCG